MNIHPNPQLFYGDVILFRLIFHKQGIKHTCVIALFYGEKSHSGKQSHNIPIPSSNSEFRVATGFSFERGGMAIVPDE
jgi:hypothetical protein